MRKFITSTLGAILVFTVITGTADAANYTNTSFGISIDVDDAMSKMPLWRDTQNFTTEDKSAALMIKRIHDLSIVEFLEELRGVGYRDTRDRITLGISGKPIEAEIESGRGQLIPVKGRIGKHRVKGVIGAYSGHNGQGFVVIGTAKPEQWDAWEPRMKTMFYSVRFVEVDRAAMIKEWENRLKGKKLQTMQPKPHPLNTKAKVQRNYHLCSDGSVMREPVPVRRVPGQNMQAASRSRNQDRGTWFVVVARGAPYLIVREGKEQKRLKLEDEGDNFLLNGKRYLITANKLCK